MILHVEKVYFVVCHSKQEKLQLVGTLWVQKGPWPILADRADLEYLTRNTTRVTWII